MAKGSATMAEIDGVGNNGDGGIGSMPGGGGGSYEEMAEGGARQGC